MSWVIRLGIFVLVLGIAIRFGPCFAEDYVIDIYGPDDSSFVVDEYSLSTPDTCNTDGFWIFPPFYGTCYASLQNCTTANGIQLYPYTYKCSGTDVCCYLIPNSTMPTIPPVTQPASGLPNCTVPTAMPEFNPSNPNLGAFQPNCTNATLPTLPAVTAATVAG